MGALEASSVLSRVIFLAAVVLSVVLVKPAEATAKVVVLANNNLSISIEAGSGRITKITNYLTGESVKVESSEFSIDSDIGRISSGDMKVKSIKRIPNGLRLTLAGSYITVQLHYLLGTAWVEKWISFTSGVPLNLKRITMGNRKFSPAFQRIHAHTDNTSYNVPINWFLRSKKGGWYTGIEFPFTEGKQQDGKFMLSFGGWSSKGFADKPRETPSQVQLKDINIRIESGEEFIGEKEFLGVFKYTGLSAEKALTGIPRIITTVSEKLDWGEVFAMQKFMRHILPTLPTTQNEFSLYMNGWWAGTPGGPIDKNNLPTHKKAIDVSKEIGAHYFAFSPTWMGMDEYIMRSSRFIRTLGKDGNFKLSDAAEKAVDYVREQGMVLSAYSVGASYYREDKPDWKLISKDGGKSNQVCWANHESADWLFNVHSRILKKYPIVKFWHWDGGWLPGEHLEWLMVPEGGGRMVPTDVQSWECYATNHSHLPGNIAYPFYKNVISIFKRLRQSNPGVALGVAWAVKSGGPWALRYLDVFENFYENPSPDDLRFQMWYLQNFYFVPPDRYMAQVWFEKKDTEESLPKNDRDTWKMWFSKNPRNYRYGLMSALSSGSNVGYIVQFPNFKSPAEKTNYLAFMKEWKQWAANNLRYLRSKRSLFGQPLRKNGIDGSAHIIHDRGFFFLFNPTEERYVGSIPLNNWIDLKSKNTYQVTVIFPEKQKSLGTYAFGENLLVDMPPGTCKLLQIVPGKANSSRQIMPVAGAIQEAF